MSGRRDPRRASRLRRGAGGVTPLTASSFASATAASKMSPSAIASIRPSRSASAAETGAPVTIIRSAIAGPTARGRRCVPPPPGSSPSFTSGWPSFVPGAATRAWQPSAISSPPPKVVPWSAATMGFCIASSAAATSPVNGFRRGLPNSLMSAPATNVRPAQASTAALSVSSASMLFAASTRPLRMACESALTGGLSIVTTATSPSLSIWTRGVLLTFLPEPQSLRSRPWRRLPPARSLPPASSRGNSGRSRFCRLRRLPSGARNIRACR